MTAIATAARDLAEAVTLTRRDRALAPAAARLRTALRKHWRAQRIAVVKHLRAKRADLFAEAITPEDADWPQISAATARHLAVALDAEYPSAMASGASHAITDCAADISFDVAHPDAVAFLTSRGAAQVTAIDEATRSRLATLLAHAADEGWSWGQTAREIESLFGGFSGAVPQTFLRTRAELVASTELAYAYEEGQTIVRGDLVAQGLVVVKSWLTVADDRVDPHCLANAGAGWIPHDQAFPSGASAPPDHPACRCSSLSKVVTGETE